MLSSKMLPALLLLAGLFCHSLIQAQLQILTPCPIVVEDTIPTVNKLDEFTVHNAGTEALDVAWRKTNLSVPSGWTSFLCDPNNCWGAMDEEPLGPSGLMPSTLEPGETLTSDAGGYVLRYSAESVPGTLVYEFEIYDINDPANSASCEITVNGVVGLSTSLNETLAPELELYPNPASDFLSVRAPAEYTAWLQDLTGRQLAVISQNGLDVSGYPNGLYLVTWLKDNQPVHVDRLLIGH